MILSAGPAAGAAGDLDPTFGSGGKVITQFFPSGGRAGALAIQPDGKIVASGFVNRFGSVDFTLVRYLPNGSLDASFGNGGMATVAFPERAAEVTALAILPDGKIVAGGDVFRGTLREADFALARFHPNGALDTSFGDGGRVTTDFGGAESASGMALLPDGRIVLAGRIAEISANGIVVSFAVALYESDGSLSPGFGSGGKVITDFGFDEVAEDVVVQPDGRIVAAGVIFFNGHTRVALARYNLDGSLDTSFGGDGRVTTIGIVPDSEQGFAAALQPDGRIVVGGTRLSDTSFDFVVERFLANGDLDTSFGTGGSATLDFSGYEDQVRAVVLQPDGGIVLAGFAQSGPDFADRDFALARYTAHGALDTSFGAAGRTTTDFFGFHDQIDDVALQADGRIVVAGYASTPDPTRIGEFTLARYLGTVNAPPVITGAAASPAALGPPNHKMIDVTVSYSVTDDQTPAPSCALSVTSNEPVNGTGDGDTDPDWRVVDSHRVQLRAERSGQGSGRIYTITITCTDGAGASARRSVTVSVPRGQGKS